MTVQIGISELRWALQYYENCWGEMRRMLAQKLPAMTAEQMVDMLISFDELEHELGSAPDSDFVEALAYDTGTEPEEVDRFWKYLAMGDFDAEWED